MHDQLSDNRISDAVKDRAHLRVWLIRRPRPRFRVQLALVCRRLRDGVVSDDLTVAFVESGVALLSVFDGSRFPADASHVRRHLKTAIRAVGRHFTWFDGPFDGDLLRVRAPRRVPRYSSCLRVGRHL